MKKVFVFVALIALVAVAFTGCKKDEAKPSYSGDFTINTKSYNVTPMGFMELSFVIGGTTTTTYILSGSGSNEANSLMITLSSKTVTEITVNSKNTVTLDIGDDSYTAKSGKITITKSDENTIEGKFDCKFVKNSAGDEITGTGTFSSLKLSK